MPASPRLNIRVSPALAEKLGKEAEKRNKTTSETARELLAEALSSKRLASVPPRGRPTISENP